MILLSYCSSYYPLFLYGLLFQFGFCPCLRLAGSDVGWNSWIPTNIFIHYFVAKVVTEISCYNLFVLKEVPGIIRNRNLF